MLNGISRYKRKDHFKQGGGIYIIQVW